jgi:hypothetical protein
MSAARFLAQARRTAHTAGEIGHLPPPSPNEGASARTGLNALQAREPGLSRPTLRHAVALGAARARSMENPRFRLWRSRPHHRHPGGSGTARMRDRPGAAGGRVWTGPAPGRSSVVHGQIPITRKEGGPPRLVTERQSRVLRRCADHYRCPRPPNSGCHRTRPRPTPRSSPISAPLPGTTPSPEDKKPASCEPSAGSCMRSFRVDVGRLEPLASSCQNHLCGPAKPALRRAKAERF